MKLRHSLFVVPGLLLVGCGDTPTSVEDEQGPIEEHDSDKPDDIPANDELVAAALISTSPSCDAASIAFEATASWASYSIAPQISCQWDFGDGTTGSDCNGSHVYATGGLYTITLEVTDVLYGAKDTVVQQRLVRSPLQASLEASAPACGLEISYSGSVNEATEVHVFVEPGGQVVLDDPLYHTKLVNTVKVTQPGVYTVRLAAEDERFDDTICTKEVVKEVTVVACPGDEEPDDDHEHEPGCGH